MRGIRVSVLLAALSVLAILGVFSCGTQQRDEKVVFIDLDTVISEEKKRIFPVGVVNPLDHISLSKSILVLREDQVKRALEETGKRGEKTILLLTDGDIRRVSSLADRMVYKATLFMLRRLGIEKVPSLVEQEGRELRVWEMVLK